MKKVLCIFISLVISLTIFIVPSFADTVTPLSLPYSDDISQSSVITNGVAFHNATSGQPADHTWYALSNHSDTYLCIVYGVNNTKNYHPVIVFSSSLSDAPLCYFSSPYLGSNTVWSSNSSVFTSGEWSYRYNGGIYGSPETFFDNVPVFSSVSDFDDYLLTFEGSSSSPVSSWVNKPLTIPQGYAAVIDTTNMTSGKGGFRLRANTGNLGNSNLWRDVFGNDNIQSGQAVYSTNTSITSYNFDSYPQLTWSPCEYSLVRATAYEYISEAPKSSTFTYIFNPIQANAQAVKTGQPINAYITLYMNDSFDGNVKLFPLTSMAALGEGQRIDVSETETGSGDISNGTWTDGNGHVVSPPQGGGNGEGSSTNPLQAISSTIESLGNTIRDFAANVANLLSAPVEAIQTLIGAGSEFVGNLSGLYTWLPPQVYSVLTSAIILVIVIGVLKVLL